MKYVIHLFLLSTIVACSTANDATSLKRTFESKKQSDYWVLFEDYDVQSKFPPFGSVSGYLDQKGDTMIPMNKYPRCYTEKFYYYAVVFDQEFGFIGINRKGEKLFNVVQTDEFDFFKESDGMIEIEENGKYGFANYKGEIVIKPQYACVSSFHNGKAQVCFSCSLSPKADEEHTIMEMKDPFFIDKTGKRIE